MLSRRGLSAGMRRRSGRVLRWMSGSEALVRVLAVGVCGNAMAQGKANLSPADRQATFRSVRSRRRHLGFFLLPCPRPPGLCLPYSKMSCCNLSPSCYHWSVLNAYLSSRISRSSIHHRTFYVNGLFWRESCHPTATTVVRYHRRPSLDLS